MSILKKRRNDIVLFKCSQNIKKYRLEKKLTQEDISFLLQMDFSQYGRIERGKTNITISTLYDISKILEIDIHKLLEFEH